MALQTPPNRKIIDEPTEYSFVGTVQHEGWSKSGQSYAAGGSDYYGFVYKIPNTENAMEFVILRGDPSKTNDIKGVITLLENAAKTRSEVQITGWKRLEQITEVDDSAQHPVRTRPDGSVDTNPEEVPTFLIKSVTLK